MASIVQKPTTSTQKSMTAFSNLTTSLTKVLNRTFQMILPPTSNKFQGTISLAENKNDEGKKGEGKEGNKKCKNKNGNSNLVGNHGKPDKFKIAEGENGRKPLQICSPAIDLHGMIK